MKIITQSRADLREPARHGRARTATSRIANSAAALSPMPGSRRGGLNNIQIHECSFAELAGPRDRLSRAPSAANRPQLLSPS
jgi:hypothetical protein